MRKNSKVKYMQTVLGESLLVLLKTKPIEKITVTDICKLVEINRGTFYAYFLNPLDLFSKIEEELYKELVAHSDRPTDLSKVAFNDYFRRQFDLYYDYKDLMQVLFGEFGDRKFLVKCAMIGYEGAISDWHTMAPNIDRSYLEYIFAYIYNGCLGIVELWIKNGFRENPVEMAALVTKFFTGSLEKYLS